MPADDASWCFPRIRAITAPIRKKLKHFGTTQQTLSRDGTRMQRENKVIYTKSGDPDHPPINARASLHCCPWLVPCVKKLCAIATRDRNNTTKKQICRANICDGAPQDPANWARQTRQFPRRPAQNVGADWWCFNALCMCSRDCNTTAHLETRCSKAIRKNKNAHLALEC